MNDLAEEGWKDNEGVFDAIHASRFLIKIDEREICCSMYESKFSHFLWDDVLLAQPHSSNNIAQTPNF